MDGMSGIMRSLAQATCGLLLPLAFAAACGQRSAGPPMVPGASAPAAATVPPRRYVNADVQFMQHMIEHHGQALTMTALVPERAASEIVRLMAQRIEVSQRDEIARMRRWLVERGEVVPATDGAHQHHGVGDSAVRMPGMLAADELQRLSASTGGDFDRLFLEYMIRHHEGALVMVAELFATPGAGQELDIFRFASDVDADQRAEIRRMKLVRDRLPAEKSGS